MIHIASRKHAFTRETMAYQGSLRLSAKRMMAKNRFSNAVAVQGHQAFGGVQHGLDIGRSCGDRHPAQTHSRISGL
jgi:hypothetical protein